MVILLELARDGWTLWLPHPHMCAASQCVCVLQDILAGIMMSNYSRIQSKAGRTVGVERGEAWRAALEVRRAGAGGRGDLVRENKTRGPCR